MPKKWSDVAASAAFQALTPEEQEEARQQYFEEVVASRVPDEDLDFARGQFDEDTLAEARRSAVNGAAGMRRLGNIDIFARPRVRNADGSISTVRSMSFGTDEGEVLVPTVSDDGRIIDDEEAKQAYLRSGRHLGIFDTPESATKYAEALHDQQDALSAREAEELSAIKSPITRSLAPLTEQTRTAIRARYDAATPEQRARMIAIPGAIGQFAKELQDRYALMDEIPLGPAGRATDRVDTRSEARERHLTLTGVAPDAASVRSRYEAEQALPTGQGLPEQDLPIGEAAKRSVQRGWKSLKQLLPALDATTTAFMLQQMDAIDRGEIKSQDELGVVAGYYLDTKPEDRAEFRKRWTDHLPAEIAADVEGIARLEREKRAIPGSFVTERVMRSESFRQAASALASDPIQFLADIGPESLVSSAPGIVGAIPATMLVGPAGGAATIGANSFAVDMAQTLIGGLQESGVDTTNPQALRAALNDPKLMQPLIDKAVKRAVVVGGIDAASGGVASKILLPAKTLASRPLAREVANLAVQTPAQGALGAAGEAGGQLAAGERIRPGDVLAEAVGEFAGAPAEVASMAFGRGEKAIDASGQSGVTNHTPPDSLSHQAGLTDIVVPNVSPAKHAETAKEFGFDQLQENVNVSPTNRAPAVPPAGGTSAGADATGGVVATGSAPVVEAPVDPAAVPGVDRAATGAVPDAAGEQAAPIEVWFGRRGDGYVTEPDAQQALPGRQKRNPELSWRIEKMASGKYQLAGYASQAPAQAAPAAPAKMAAPPEIARREKWFPDATAERLSEEQAVRLYEQRSAAEDPQTVEDLGPFPDATAERLAEQQELDVAAHDAATSPTNGLPEPTDAQKEAGNYKKGHLRVQGLDISIENPQGSIRRSKADAKERWEVTMPAHYGYFRGTEGADGDHVDVTLGPQPGNEALPVFVFDQANEAGKFDEHKVFMGFANEAEARSTYRASFAGDFGQKMESSLLGVRKFTPGAFKEWLASSDHSRPASGGKVRVPEAAQAIQAEEKGPQAPGAPASAATIPAAPETAAELPGAGPEGLRLAPPAPLSLLSKVNDTLRDSAGVEIERVRQQDLSQGARIASALARVFKKTLTVVRAQRGDPNAPPSGMLNRLGGKHIIVAENAEDAPLFVAVHELYHSLPAEQRTKLNTALLELTHEDKHADFVREFGYADSEVAEELPAFIAQAVSKRPTFWNDVREKMGDQEFAEVAKVILAKLKEMIVGIKDAYGEDFLKKYVKDVQRAHDLLTEAYAEARRGTFKPQAEKEPVAPKAEPAEKVVASKREAAAPADDFTTEVLYELGQVDSLFKNPSNYTTVGSIRDAIAQQAPQYKWGGEDTRVDELRESGADKRFVVFSEKNKPIYIYERGNKLWLNISMLQRGEGGDRVYQALADYARAAGKRFVGDPEGLSPDAMARRTYHMLSNMIRHGDSKGFEPAPEQFLGDEEAGVAPLDWPADNVGRLKALIDSFYQTTLNQTPGIADIRYDFRKRAFVERDTGEDARWDSVFHPVRQSGVPVSASVGRRALKAAVFLQSLASSESSERPGILAQVLRQRAQLVDDGGLNPLFSRRTAASSSTEELHNANDEGGPVASNRQSAVVRRPWVFERDKLGRFRFAAGARAYRLVADVANAVLDKLKLKPVSSELGRAMRKMRSEIAAAKEKAANVAGKLGKLSAEERELISDVIEGELRAGVTPPEKILAIAANMQHIMSEQTKQLVDLGMLSKEVAGRWEGKYLPRFYQKQFKDELKAWAKAARQLFGRKGAMQGIAGNSLKARGLFKDIPAEELPVYEANGWQVRDAGFNPQESDQVTIWRDFTKQERADMNEIRDSMFRFVMGYMRSQKDIALGRLYRHIANSMASHGPKDGYVQVPDTSIEGTTAKRYGQLAGKWVPQEVMDHLSAADSSDMNEIFKLYLNGLSAWKEGRVVLNPVSHVNNIISNVTLAHMAGISYWDVHKYAGAVRDLVKKGPMVQEAKEAGLFGGTFNQAELLNNMPEQLKVLAGMSDSALSKNAGRLWNAFSWWLRKPMQAAYEGEDQFFRYLIYRDARQRGVEPDAAVEHSQEFIFTYDDLPKGARALRDTVVPFFSWTYKAVPALARTAFEYPWRFAAPAAALWGANTAMYAIAAGQDDEPWWELLVRYVRDPEYRAAVKEFESDERRDLPPWNKGATAIGTPKVVRMGRDDVTNLPMFLDVSRLMPGGDMFDTENNAGGVPWFAPIDPGGPAVSVLLGMFANLDYFTGRRIVDKSDTDAEAAEKRAAWLYQSLAPAIAPFGYHFNRNMNALAYATDTTIDLGPVEYTGFGKDGLPVQPSLAALQTFGIKLRPVDLDQSREYEEAADQRLVREINSKIAGLKRQRKAGSISDDKYFEQYERLIEKRARVKQGLTVEGEEEE